MRRLLLALATAGAAISAGAPAASAQLAFAPCQDAGHQAFECARSPQPLDRSGATPGTVTLFVRRLRTETPAPSRTALVAVAGGPGQPAAPVARSFAIALAPGLRDRDLLVFDQRGTGQSGALSCSSLRRRGTTTQVAGRCAKELGARRAFFRTTDSVEDLEALRREAGYERLAIFGVSYGTKVALDYAARYPDRVERLVLDSVLPPEGPDPLQRSSFQAVRRVLQELCGGERCRGVTPDPVRDLQTLVRRDRPLRGRYVDARGRRRRAGLRPRTLFSVLRAGDLNPAWRALLPGAARAAVRGDAAPALRLTTAALGAPSGSQSVDEAETNQALFLATLCEEGRFPWDRAAAIRARVGQAKAALRAVPDAVFRPFDRETSASSGPLGLCLGWPNATPAPDAPGPLPPVPVLVLAGGADVRTPAEDAQAVAARISGPVSVVVVPHVGHSVLGADPSGCARAAIAGFFVSGQVTPCPVAAPLLRPTARPAGSLGELARTGRVPGRAGRTLTAVLRTRDDVLVQAIGERLSGARTRFGGLRRGTVTATDRAVTLRGVEVVPGVRVSGSFPASGTARLRITGSAAARGRLTFARGGRLTGRLGGRRISLRPRSATARAARSRFRPLPDLVRAAG